MSDEEKAQKEAEITALQEALANMEKSFADRLSESEQAVGAQASSRQEKNASNVQVPHLANLNEDMMITNKLHFAFKEGANRIGKDPASLPVHQRPDTAPDIILAGAGIYKEQATVWMKAGKCTLESQGMAQATTKINGKSPENDGIPLKHGDRVA